MGNADFPDDDDDELELEPVDPEILAYEKSRASAKTDEALKKVEFDEIYEDPEHDPLLDVDKLRQFRFQTKHLLMLTAALAVVLALFQIVDSACSAIAILVVVVLTAGWGYVIRRERAERRRKDRLRAEFEAGRRPVDIPLPDMPEEVEPQASEFRFSFSTKQLLLTITGAAIAMGMLTLIPNKGAVAMLLGLVAILGLVIHAVGFEPPAIVVLAWWMLLVCYLLLGFWIAVFGDGDEGARRNIAPPPQATWASASEPGEHCA